MADLAGLTPTAARRGGVRHEPGCSDDDADPGSTRPRRTSAGSPSTGPRSATPSRRPLRVALLDGAAAYDDDPEVRVTHPARRRTVLLLRATTCAPAV